MLLALVLHTGSRRRVLAIGGVFLVITTALYGLYMIGAYSILSYLAFVTWIRVAVAVLALGFGLVNLKDFFWFGKGVSFTIPEQRKSGMYQRMRAVAVADEPLPRVLAGTAALAVGVSLIETPCTAGFPVMWANLVGAADVGVTVALTLFAVYMLVFLLDELAVLGVAVVAMRVTKVQERHGRVLKLVGGMVMVTLAGVLIFAPDMMERASGAIAVFLIAAIATVVVLLVDRVVRRSNGTIKPRDRQKPPTRKAAAH
jgi:cytochrome c biogenesis protein CcdA